MLRGDGKRVIFGCMHCHRGDGKRVIFGGMDCCGGMEREYFLEACIATRRWKESNFCKHPLLWGDGKRVIFGMHGLHWSAKTSKDIILDCTFFFGCKNRLHTKKLLKFLAKTCVRVANLQYYRI